MTTRYRGFTLLEMTLAVLIIAAISQWVISRLPSVEVDHPLDRLLQSARWATEQAQIEQRIYQLRLDPQRWQLFALTHGNEGPRGPLPDTVWQPVYDRHASGTIDDGILQLKSPPQALPVALWYMPDGDMTEAALEFIGDEGERRHLRLTRATLFAQGPE